MRRIASIGIEITYYGTLLKTFNVHRTDASFKSSVNALARDCSFLRDKVNVLQPVIKQAMILFSHLFEAPTR